MQKTRFAVKIKTLMVAIFLTGCAGIYTVEEVMILTCGEFYWGIDARAGYEKGSFDRAMYGQFPCGLDKISSEENAWRCSELQKEYEMCLARRGIARDGIPEIPEIIMREIETN